VRRLLELLEERTHFLVQLVVLELEVRELEIELILAEGRLFERAAQY